LVAEPERQGPRRRLDDGGGPRVREHLYEGVPVYGVFPAHSAAPRSQVGRR